MNDVERMDWNREASPPLALNIPDQAMIGMQGLLGFKTMPLPQPLDILNDLQIHSLHVETNDFGFQLSLNKSTTINYNPCIQGCQISTNNRYWLEENQQSINIFKRDFRKILEKSPTVIPNFGLTLFSKNLKNRSYCRNYNCQIIDFLKILNLSVQNFEIQVLDENKIREILKMVNPKFLKKIILTTEISGEKISRIDQFLDTEQWKNAKELVINGYTVAERRIGRFLDFEKVKIRMETVQGKDLILLMETLLTQKSIQKVEIEFKMLEEPDEFFNILGDPHIWSKTWEAWEFPDDETDELREILYEFRKPNLRICFAKKN